MPKETAKSKQTIKSLKAKAIIDYGISRGEFHAILDKASQPISGQGKGETSESRPADGCNETNTH